ncbi:hypothetical protein Naga_100046g47 [Nannochloropsis gaditana]|uniref:Uncharacterized protein n=1 Tax=Nannochloropsis gaditana TaxID=72520 RepID=W7TJ96_9STRA|nr:hypothetical protein Naga_100046g47 [Nannochloropsis gaditana]
MILEDAAHITFSVTTHTLKKLRGFQAPGTCSGVLKLYMAEAARQCFHGSGFSIRVPKRIDDITEFVAGCLGHVNVLIKVRGAATCLANAPQQKRQSHNIEIATLDQQFYPQTLAVGCKDKICFALAW